MFGKVIDGVLIHAPKPLVNGDKVHYHPSAELYKEKGYLLIVETPCPEVDEENPKFYTWIWEEKDGQIIKVWVGIEPPEEKKEVS